MFPKRTPVLVLLVLAAACGGRRPVPVRQAPQPAPAPARPALPTPRDVWTRQAGVRLRGDSSQTTLPYAAMRLEVIRGDSASLYVRCARCAQPVMGWVPRESVVHVPRSPAEAAAGEDLAEFVLAVRAAAQRRDVQALRAVMSPRFVHDPDGRDGVVEAFSDWEREQFRRLDRLPFLLDRGVASVPGTQLWAGPPEFATAPGYQDLRAGFRRNAQGRWEWSFFVQGARR